MINSTIPVPDSVWTTGRLEKLVFPSIFDTSLSCLMMWNLQSQRGVGIILDRRTANCVVKVQCDGDRLLMVKLKWKTVDICIILVYMPTLEHSTCRHVARIVKTRRQTGRLPPPLPLEVGHLNPARGSVGAVSSPVGSGAEPQPKSILVHFSVKIWHLVATILMIFLRINWSKKCLLVPEHSYGPDLGKNLVWYGIVWYGIVVFNVPLNTV